MIWSWPENKLFVHIPLQNRVCFWSAASSQWTDVAWELQYKASTFFGQLHTNLGSGQAVLHVVVLVVLECTLTSRNRQIVWLFLPKCFLLGHFWHITLTLHWRTNMLVFSRHWCHKFESFTLICALENFWTFLSILAPLILLIGVGDLGTISLPWRYPSCIN